MDAHRSVTYVGGRVPETRRLADVMGSEHVIRVHADGTVSDALGEYAPEALIEVDADGQIMPPGNFDDGTPGYAGSYAGLAALAEDHGWELMTAPDGTPLWDPGYFIGGDTADEIISTPGLYVRCKVSCLSPEESEDPEDSPGFVIARRVDPPAVPAVAQHEGTLRTAAPAAGHSAPVPPDGPQSALEME